MNTENETLADIVADIRMQNQGLLEDAYALSPLVCDLLCLADRIEAAAKREVEKLNSVIQATVSRSDAEIERLRREAEELRKKLGNSAKLREALGELAANIEMRSSTFGLNVMVDTKTFIDAKAALAAPARNCDVHTADELKGIFNSELVSELPIANEHEKNLVTITAMGVIDALFATAKEGGNDGK